jgi:hypothetical protein
VTVAKEPGHRGEHEVSRKTIAQGKPECFSVSPVVLPLCFLCAGPMGATGTRLSLRSLFFRGWKMMEDSGAAHRENASAHALLPDK